MGCCYSFFCKEDGSSQNGEINERTHLLVDPVSNIQNIQRVNSEDYLSRESGSLPTKTDEQSALNKILQETATNVIDVAALDSHNLQQHEYVERSKQYRIRASQVCSASRLPQTPKAYILQDVPSHEQVLISEPISSEDLQLIKSSMEKAALAIEDIKVEHKEDLVVPFHVPG